MSRKPTKPRAVLAVDDGLPARCRFRVARAGLRGDGPVFVLWGGLAGGVKHRPLCRQARGTDRSNRTDASPARTKHVTAIWNISVQTEICCSPAWVGSRADLFLECDNAAEPRDTNSHRLLVDPMQCRWQLHGVL